MGSILKIVIIPLTNHSLPLHTCFSILSLPKHLRSVINSHRNEAAADLDTQILALILLHERFHGELSLHYIEDVPCSDCVRSVTVFAQCMCTKWECRRKSVFEPPWCGNAVTFTQKINKGNIVLGHLCTYWKMSHPLFWFSSALFDVSDFFFFWFIS